MPDNPNQNNGPNAENTSEKGISLLKKELTPNQLKWAVRFAVMGILAIGGVQKINEWANERNDKKHMAEIVSILDCRGPKGKDGKRKCNQCITDSVTGDSFCGKLGKKAYNQIPKDRRDEAPVVKEMCGRKYPLRPYCWEEIEAVNHLTQAEGKCVKLRYGYRSTLNATEIFRKSLDKSEGPNGEPPETMETAIAKMQQGRDSDIRQTHRAGIPAKGPFHSSCAVDVDNWAEVDEFFHKRGFQGGEKFWGIYKGLGDDPGHFSKGEFKMRGPMRQAGDALDKLGDLIDKLKQEE